MYMQETSSQEVPDPNNLEIRTGDTIYNIEMSRAQKSALGRVMLFVFDYIRGGSQLVAGFAGD